jgi:protein phosphatase
MGGYNAGEVASGMATALIADGLQEEWNLREVDKLDRDEAKKRAETALAEHIARANVAIFNTSQNNPSAPGWARRSWCASSTTISSPWPTSATRASTGLRGEAMEQVTRDHRCCRSSSTPASSPGGGEALAEQEPGDARARDRSHGGARDPRLRDAAGRHLPPVLRWPVGHGRGRGDPAHHAHAQDNPNLTVQQLVQAANDNGGRDNIPRC